MVAYGPPEALSSCLATIGSDSPVVIVDNGSSPKARAVAEEAGARYVDPGRNLGFAGGVNLAIAQLTPPIGDVLLINPDAEITSSDIELLRRELHRDPSLACVAPVLLDASTERPIRSSWPFPSPGRAWLDAVGLGKLVPQGGIPDRRRADAVGEGRERYRDVRRAVLPLRRGDRLAAARG